MQKNKVNQSETKVLKRSEISFASYNPRKLSDEARKALKKNIKENGLLGGIVVNERTGNIVSGHQRISIADEVNKYDVESNTNDYEIKVEVIDVDDKKEKELNVFMNSKAVQGEYDYTKLASFINDIDSALAGLDEVDMEMIKVELPDVVDIEIPSFEPQADKLEKAMLEKSITQELDNSVSTPEASISEMERKENKELSDEEKKALVKEIKAKVKEGAVHEGDSFLTLSFSNYDNKVQFLERFGIDEDVTLFKGEEFAELVDQE